MELEQALCVMLSYRPLVGLPEGHLNAKQRFKSPEVAAKFRVRYRERDKIKRNVNLGIR